MKHNEPRDQELTALFETNQPAYDAVFTKQMMRRIHAEDKKFRLLKKSILSLGLALFYMLSIFIAPYLNLVTQKLLSIFALSSPGWLIAGAAIVYFGFSSLLQKLKGIS